jgi:hypothetical protein
MLGELWGLISDNGFEIAKSYTIAIWLGQSDSPQFRRRVCGKPVVHHHTPSETMDPPWRVGDPAVPTSPSVTVEALPGPCEWSPPPRGPPYPGQGLVALPVADAAAVATPLVLQTKVQTARETGGGSGPGCLATPLPGLGAAMGVPPPPPRPAGWGLSQTGGALAPPPPPAPGRALQPPRSASAASTTTITTQVQGPSGSASASGAGFAYGSESVAQGSAGSLAPPPPPPRHAPGPSKVQGPFQLEVPNAVNPHEILLLLL